MLHEKGFNLMEAIILLNVYLESKERGVKSSSAIKDASAILRAIALNSGYEIDKGFRSTAGLQSQFGRIAAIYKGGADSYSLGPKVFSDAIELYLNHRRDYDKILMQAKKILPWESDWLNSKNSNHSVSEDLASEEGQEKKDTNKPVKNLPTATEFFAWLSSAVPKNVAKDIANSYKTIIIMLLRNRVFDKSLFMINDLSQIEDVISKTKSIFANKKLQANANLLLTQYIKFLKVKGNVENDGATELEQKDSNDDSTGENWILYNFENESDFVETRPVKCTIQGKLVEGKTWAQILVAITNHEIERNNPAMENLYAQNLIDSILGKPYLMTNKISGLNCAQLKNGYWINVNYSLPYILKLIKNLCIFCGYTENQVVLYGASKKSDVLTNRSCDPIIPEKILEAIRHSYAKGFRFEETVIHLLEQASSTKIDLSLLDILKTHMFHRKDDIYFLPEMICNTSQARLLNKNRLVEELLRCGCIDVEALYSQYKSLGELTCLRQEEDFEDYLTFLMPAEVRFSNAFKTRIIRRAGVKVADALRIATEKVVSDIEAEGCIALDDLLIKYPFFSDEFLRLLLMKYTDAVIPLSINDLECYQTVESLGLGDEFSSALSDCLCELENLSLQPSQEVIHALLSIKLGCNLREEYSIPDAKTFRRVISAYYNGEKEREWKSGNFLEVNG